MLEAIIRSLQFNSFIQKGVRRLKLGMGAVQDREGNSRSAPQANSQQLTLPSATKRGRAAPKFQSRQTCPPLPK